MPNRDSTRGARNDLGASTSTFVAATWVVLGVVGAVALVLVSQFSTRVTTDETGLTDRVARSGSQMIVMWIAAGVVAVALAAGTSALLTERALRRRQALWASAALGIGGPVAAVAGISTARSLGYSRSAFTYLAVGFVVFVIVTAALMFARAMAARADPWTARRTPPPPR